MDDYESVGPGRYRLLNFSTPHNISWDMIKDRFNSDERWYGPLDNGKYYIEVYDETVEVSLEEDNDSLEVNLGDEISKIEEEDGDVLKDVQIDVLEEYFLPHYVQPESLDEILAPQLDPEPVDYYGD
jgi:hypothetical protein